MNRVYTLFLLFCFAVSLNTAHAESITENQARGIAANFMATHLMPSASLKMAQKAPRLNASAGTDKAAYYVFNASHGGYVIVAGDNRAPAVLGYSDKGSFDPQNVPESMQYLLEGYAAQIDALALGAKAAPKLKSSGVVTPLVKAAWSQNNPYNILLPYLPSGKHAYAGCVATAMAQVMYYWKWPARPTRSIPAYTSTATYSSTDVLTYDMPELPVIDFDWDMMHDTYQTSDTVSQAALAAATLTLYCAQAVEMNFKKTSSGANTTTISNRAATYFDYDNGAHMVERSSYSTQGWADLLYGELAAGRPVIFSGRKRTGGHAFICDGCDGNGMFHFNWGWNGDSNGYFLLSILNPDSQGTGSASGAYGYILDQAAIVGFQPNKGGSAVFELTATNFVLNSFTDAREDVNDSFVAYVTTEFHNNTSDTIAVRFGWGLFNENGEMIDRLYSTYNQTLRPGFYHNMQNKMLEFGEGLTSGTYRIMPMFSEYGQDNWRPCPGAEDNYLEVIINGNECTFSGYGTVGECNYVINDISITGNMHNGRPVDIDINMTNNGQSNNRILNMFANGVFAAAGFVGLGPGETGDIHFTYLFENAGNYTLTWSWNDDGSDPIATRTVTINPMPAANLSASIEVLNVTNNTAGSRTITSDKFSMMVTITNNGQTTYDEDISAKLYKNTSGSSGTYVQGVNKHLTLDPGETTTMQFDLTNVIDGWKYFAYICCYSEGIQTKINSTYSYTIVFPEVPDFTPGDVNDDSLIDVSDVTLMISNILNGTELNFLAGDLNNDGKIDVSDVTALIQIVLDQK